ncbi:Mdm33 family-domain-containing protein [Irpex rosettiformis]|uniref:Mdm33 family-domain-containing protein n=1 Tax=Irpex rosettiformis TaxID=378272 RepID=A0ACB8U2Z0_9APHY|nr:Mdm33 family-domain-containing protein [Irpex rosettiformis]
MLRLFPRPTSRPLPSHSLRPPCYYNTQRRWLSTTPPHPLRPDTSSTHESSSTPVPDSASEPQLHKNHDASQLASGSKTAPIGSVDVDKLKERLRTWAEDTAVALRGRADQYTSSAIKAFAQLGRELNKVTGYQEIEALKKVVSEQEARITTARTTARTAKQAYEHAVHARAKSQREVNDLLQRKSSWSDDDVSRFTSLVRQDHLFEQAEHRAKQQAEHTEGDVEREFSELMRVILNRYHEEQVWSDKIRSASTYGQLTVLGLNMLVFLLAIILVEPWKRKRLAQTFERKVEEMTETNTRAFGEETKKLVEQLEKQEKEMDRLREVITYSLQPSAAVLHEAGATVVEQTDVIMLEEGMETTQPPEAGSEKAGPLLHSESQWIVTVAASTTAGLLGVLAGYYLSH